MKKKLNAKDKKIYLCKRMFSFHSFSLLFAMSLVYSSTPSLSFVFSSSFIIDVQTILSVPFQSMHACIHNPKIITLNSFMFICGIIPSYMCY